jgi:hypothetical protein
MKIVSLYPNEVYQVVSEDESTVYFQGSKDDCEKYLTRKYNLDELAFRKTIELLTFK